MLHVYKPFYIQIFNALFYGFSLIFVYISFIKHPNHTHTHIYIYVYYDTH